MLPAASASTAARSWLHRATPCLCRRLLSTQQASPTSSTSTQPASAPNASTSSPAPPSVPSSASPSQSTSSNSAAEATAPQGDAVKKLSWAQRDELLRKQLLDRDGGQFGVSTENGEWNGLRTHVKNNMFRLI